MIDLSENVEVILDCNLVFKKRERERGDGLHIAHTQMMLEDAFSLVDRSSFLSATDQRKKKVVKRALFPANGFLPFQETLSHPIINAIIRGSEDGAENIAAPAFRPVNCFSPKCWGKYFYHESFLSICYLLGSTECILISVYCNQKGEMGFLRENLNMPLKKGQAISLYFWFFWMPNGQHWS